SLPRTSRCAAPGRSQEPRRERRRRSAPPLARSARAVGQASRRRRKLTRAGTRPFGRHHGVRHAAGFEKGDAQGRTQENGTLGIDLTAQRIVRDHGDLRKVGLCRHPGARVDQVMHGVAPAPPADSAGADGALAERDERAVTEPDVPAVAGGTGAADSEVATQIADSIFTVYSIHKVGLRTLRAAVELL